MRISTIQSADRDSVFTRLDFRSKLYMAFVITVLVFLWESPLMQFGMAMLVTAFCLLAGVRWSYLRTVLVIMLPFYLILLASHARAVILPASPYTFTHASPYRGNGRVHAVPL